jgi:hypothetical protein
MPTGRLQRRCELKYRSRLRKRGRSPRIGRGDSPHGPQYYVSSFNQRPVASFSRDLEARVAELDRAKRDLAEVEMRMYGHELNEPAAADPIPRSEPATSPAAIRHLSAVRAKNAAAVATGEATRPLHPAGPSRRPPIPHTWYQCMLPSATWDDAVADEAVARTAVSAVVGAANDRHAHIGRLPPRCGCPSAEGPMRPDCHLHRAARDAALREDRLRALIDRDLPEADRKGGVDSDDADLAAAIAASLADHRNEERPSSHDACIRKAPSGGAREGRNAKRHRADADGLTTELPPSSAPLEPELPPDADVLYVPPSAVLAAAPPAASLSATTLAAATTLTPASGGAVAPPVTTQDDTPSCVVS